MDFKIIMVKTGANTLQLGINNGFKIQYRTSTNSPWTFPISFNTTSYIIGPFYWIDTITGPSVSKKIASCSWTVVAHSSWPVGGVYAIGY